MEDEKFSAGADSLSQMEDEKFSAGADSLSQMEDEKFSAGADSLSQDVIDNMVEDAIDVSDVSSIVDEKYNLAKDNELYQSLLTAICNGNNKLAQSVVLQTMDIDADWIDIIEDGLFSIEKIVKRPKLFIRDDRELVGIERAKRVDSLAVRHLSTHTEYIRQVGDDGRVMPSKIMTRTFEDELAIYENRFVYALVERLRIFVEKRYSVIKEQSKILNKTAFSYKSGFKFGKAEVDYNLAINVRTPNGNISRTEQNAILLEKLENINKRIAIIEGSEFAHIMQKAKPVRSPIQKTNILAGQVDYKNCYDLWIRLSGFNSVGYSVDIVEKPLPFDDDYFTDLTRVVAATLEVMLANNVIRKADFRQVKDQKKKHLRYRVSNNAEYSVDKLDKKMVETDNEINQFYYNRMKKMVADIEKLSTAIDEDDRGVEVKKINFRRYFKGVEKINNAMYLDILNMNDVKPNPLLRSDPLSKKKADIAKQKKDLERYRLLSSLKKEEVRLALLREQTQLKKLEKMEKDLVDTKRALELKANKLAEKKALEKKKADRKKREEMEAKAKLAAKERIRKERERRRKEREKIKKEKELARLANEKSATERNEQANAVQINASNAVKENTSNAVLTNTSNAEQNEER